MPVPGLSQALALADRVFLRPPAESDADEYLALRRESEHTLRPWEPRPPQGLDPFSPRPSSATSTRRGMSAASRCSLAGERTAPSWAA